MAAAPANRLQVVCIGRDRNKMFLMASGGMLGLYLASRTSSESRSGNMAGAVH